MSQQVSLTMALTLGDDADISGGVSDFIELEDGSGSIELEDASGLILLEA